MTEGITPQEDIHAPLKGELKDYLNTFYSFEIGIKNALGREEALADVLDDELLVALEAARKVRPVQTAEEHFKNQRGWSDDETSEELNAHPKRVARLNEIVQILNTANDAPSFKQALNEAYQLVGSDYRPFP